eukprot:2815965-Pyramimonas_sp.AAC.1
MQRESYLSDPGRVCSGCPADVAASRSRRLRRIPERSDSAGRRPSVACAASGHFVGVVALSLATMAIFG